MTPEQLSALVMLILMLIVFGVPWLLFVIWMIKKIRKM